ncbi:hypothetical protein AWW68_18545 [Roseivirga spongicola]|uniref:Peptidase S8/S53 domain-containing protein n=1 Tax=Roseivirga spongicola TaxID=333140 RepID=A0A150WXJ4_9BACT|nr:S8 family peptidase [Roseivirga spongicola]KYG71208.1 hypothetical protein AWW68_18545 [Roseivirga spongicola]
MSNKPLLIFPKPSEVDRTPLNPGFGRNNKPGHGRQVERIEGRFTLLAEALENKRVFLQQNVVGTAPEMVLVLEFIGTVTNFFNAVKKVPELEFLAELEDVFESDDDFHRLDQENQRQEGDLTGQLFLIMTNQEALSQLQRLWEHYKNDTWERSPAGRIAGGIAKFRDVFAALKDIRPYSIQDRLRDTGFENYINDYAEFGNPMVPFEIELFHRSNRQEQRDSRTQIEGLLQRNEGRIIQGSEVILDEIQYHALIAEAPALTFNDLSEQSNVAFLQCEQVMHFRPVGQVTGGPTDIDEDLPEIAETENQVSDLPPVAALLDGYPFANHTSVKGKLVVDDPEDYLSKYEATEMLHGTAMASLIINGDLDDDQNLQLSRSLYVRPIMHPQATMPGEARSELVPTNRLPIDLIHRAVKRMFEGEHGEAAVTPNVKVINLSIGDPVRPFHINISAWAKLLDWLSVKYNVLFIVSAGNWTEEIMLDMRPEEFQALPDERKRSLIFETIKNSNLQARKILTPSEAINGLTVGASYSDQELNLGAAANFPLFDSSNILAAYSRIGLGYHKAIKPDILNAGGRLPYRVDIVRSRNNTTTLKVAPFSYTAAGPGQRIATPGSAADLTRTAYTAGTSNAAALTTRLAVQLHEVLDDINTELPPERQISEVYFPVLLKALLAHGTSWDGSGDILHSVLSSDPQINNVKDHICSYLGYGTTDANRILYCTDQRVTLLGFGEIKKDTGHEYTFPLPNILNQGRYKKRLAVTLAWLSPLNFNTAKYRQAALYFNNLTYDRDRRPDEPIHFRNSNAGFRIARRGTIQHHILEDDEVGYYIDGTDLKINVNCKEDAGGLKKQLVKYGLAVTLEVRENVPVPIYQEIEQRIQSQTRIRL